ncbi:MAG: VOC family protein [Gemmatimonadetes bacterium]|nr:VOC family protein [Gemmatimonadota bacterium]
MTRLHSVHPVLPAQDVPVSIGFYVERLGFQLAFADSTKDPRYAGVRRDEVEIHLQWHDPGERDRVERPQLRFFAPEVERLYDEFKRADVFHEKTRLRDTAWGTREFGFFDPDWNGLTFYRDLRPDDR